jgi:hypothetical protein
VSDLGVILSRTNALKLRQFDVDEFEYACYATYDDSITSTQSTAFQNSVGFFDSDAEFTGGAGVKIECDFSVYSPRSSANTNNTLAGVLAQNAFVALQALAEPYNATISRSETPVVDSIDEAVTVTAPPPPPPDAPTTPIFVAVKPATPTNYDDANAFCVTTYGSNLAVSRTGDEDHHIGQAVQLLSGISDSDKFWIGLRHDGNNWIWANGGALGGLYKWSGFNASGVAESSGYCGYRRSEGDWFSETCSAALTGFVCDLREAPAPPPPHIYASPPPPPARALSTDAFACPHPQVTASADAASGELVIEILTRKASNADSSTTPFTSITFDSTLTNLEYGEYMDENGHFNVSLFGSEDFDGVCGQNSVPSYELHDTGFNHGVCTQHNWERAQTTDADTSGACDTIQTTTFTGRYADLRQVERRDGARAVMFTQTDDVLNLAGNVFVVELGSSNQTARYSAFPFSASYSRGLSASATREDETLYAATQTAVVAAVVEPNTRSFNTTFELYARRRSSDSTPTLSLDTPTLTGSGSENSTCSIVSETTGASGLSFAQLPPSLRTLTLEGDADNRWDLYLITARCVLASLDEGDDFDVTFSSGYDMIHSSGASNLGSVEIRLAGIMSLDRNERLELVFTSALLGFNESVLSDIHGSGTSLESLPRDAFSVRAPDSSVLWGQTAVFAFELADPSWGDVFDLKVATAVLSAHTELPTGASIESSYRYLNATLETDFCALSTAVAAFAIPSDDERLDWADSSLQTVIGGLSNPPHALSTLSGSHFVTSSRGLAFPVRHVLRLPTGEGGGFFLQMCVVIDLETASGARRRMLLHNQGAKSAIYGSESVKFGDPPSPFHVSPPSDDSGGGGDLSLLGLAIVLPGALIVAGIVVVAALYARPPRARRPTSQNRRFPVR